MFGHRAMWAAGLVAALCVTAADAQAPRRMKKVNEDTAFLSALFGSQPKAKARPAPGVTAVATDGNKATDGPAVADPAVEKARAESAYFRREEVCDRLRQIAADTNNSELSAEADLLYEEAKRLYNAQTNRLTGQVVGAAAESDAGAVDDTARILSGKASRTGNMPRRVTEAGGIDRGAAPKGGSR